MYVPAVAMEMPSSDSPSSIRDVPAGVDSGAVECNNSSG